MDVSLNSRGNVLLIVEEDPRELLVLPLAEYQELPLEVFEVGAHTKLQLMYFEGIGW
jgi:hypothetical protein